MTENIYSVLQAKLATQYTTTPNRWPELWQAYWADPLGGNNNGVPLVGDALVAWMAAHGGGTGGFTAKLQAFTAALSWTPPTAVEDTFTAANGTSLSGRTPSPTTAGFNWVVSTHGGEAFEIQSNKANAIGDVGGQYVGVDAGVADCTVSATCRFPTGTPAANVGLAVRIVGMAGDQDNISAFFNSQGNGGLSLQVINSSIGTTRGTFAFTPNLDQDYLIEVVLLGTSVKVKLDGVERISYTLAGAEVAKFSTATKHGIYVYESGAPRPIVDSFKVAP